MRTKTRRTRFCPPEETEPLFKHLPAPPTPKRLFPARFSHVLKEVGAALEGTGSTCTIALYSNPDPTVSITCGNFHASLKSEHARPFSPCTVIYRVPPSHLGALAGCSVEKLVGAVCVNTSPSSKYYQAEFYDFPTGNGNLDLKNILKNAQTVPAPNTTHLLPLIKTGGFACVSPDGALSVVSGGTAAAAASQQAVQMTFGSPRLIPTIQLLAALRLDIYKRMAIVGDNLILEGNEWIVSVGLETSNEVPGPLDMAVSCRMYPHHIQASVTECDLDELYIEPNGITGKRTVEFYGKDREGTFLFGPKTVHVTFDSPVPSFCITAPARACFDIFTRSMDFTLYHAGNRRFPVGIHSNGSWFWGMQR